MEEALNNNTKPTNERLKVNADELNYVTDPKLDDHAAQCAPQCEVTLQNCKNPEFSEDKELTTAEGHTSFTNKKALHNDDDDLKKVLLGDDGGKSINGSSSKTVIIHVTGVKRSVCPSNILNSVGNDESCLDIGIQRQEEVSCHLFDQPSLATMRKRFASYISYSGSDSGTSDSESLDLNDQKKDGFQTDQIIQTREQEIAPKCYKRSNDLQENKKKADENSEAEKESSFSGNNGKFSMKWNITAKKVESIKNLTPVQGIWEEDALMSHTEDRRLHNAFEMRTSARRSSSNSTNEKTWADDEDPGKIFDDKEDIIHGQIQTNVFLVNEESNRCTSRVNGMTARHDSSLNVVSTHTEETQKKTFQVNNGCSRDELCEQEFEDSREMSSSFKKGNGNLTGSKESEIEDEDCTKIERPRRNSRNANKSIKNANENIQSLDCSSTQERPLKNEGSKIKNSHFGFGIMKDDSCPCSSSSTSHVERYQKHELVLSHGEEKKSEKLNSVTKCRSSDRETKNLAIKKECLDSGIASDECVTFKNHKKSDVHNNLINESREAEGKNSASKQTLLKRRTCKVSESEKETRNDDAEKILNRRQTAQSISLEKENCLQKKSTRESPSMDKQTAKQSHLDNEEDSQKSFSQRQSVSPAKHRWQRKSRESRSRERESIYIKRPRVDSNDAEELKARDYRSRSTRRSASPANERWQRKYRESTSTDRESKYLKRLHLDDDNDDDDDDWKSSSWHRGSRRSASPERERWQRKSPERTSPDRERKRSHHDDDNDYESNSNYYRSRNPRQTVSPARECWQRKSPENTSPDRERKRSHFDDDDDYESNSNYYRSRSPRPSASPERERWQRKSRERTSPDRERKRSHHDDDDDYESNSNYYRSRSPRPSASPERERWQRKSRERTSPDRERKRSHHDDDDDYESNSNYYRSRSPRPSASPERKRWQRKSRERTSREKDSRYSNQSHEDNDDHDWKSYSWPRGDSRGRWQRTSLDRETKRSHVDDDDDYESNSTYHRNRSPRPSASPARERWCRTSREKTSLDRESRRSRGDNDDNDDWKSSCRRRNLRRSASLEKEHWRRKSRERTSLDRESRRSHDDNDDWKSSCRRRNSRRSASLEKEHWRRRSRERTSLDRESRRSHDDNNDDDDWKSSCRRRKSRRSASLENERRQRTSRESRSTERESERAVGNSRNLSERTFRSPAPRPSKMRQDQQTRRRLISESPEMSWIHNIVVKIADPPRFPIRKRRNQKDRRFIQRSKVERSRNTKDKPPTTSENKSGNDIALKKKRRWTYDDYTKQTDGSLKRKREFSDEEEKHYAWKRYDDERTMPYQGYADSQVQSLLKQLCGDYLTKLCFKESSNKEKTSCQNAHGNDKNGRNHRSWFMTSSEWIVHGIQDTRAEDLTKQTDISNDTSPTATTTTTKTVPVVWYTAPHLISTKDENACENKTKTEKLGTNEQENQAKPDKVYDKKEVDQPSPQKESLTTIEKVAIQTSPVDNNQSQNGQKLIQTFHSDASEKTVIDSNVGSDSFSYDSLGSMNSWNTSVSCNDAFVHGQMARNDLLVMVTPSSYWYEKQFLQEKNENLPTEESKMDHHHHHPSLYIPTSFSSTRLTNVSSFSTCFHCDTSMFEFSPHIPDSSDVDEINEQKSKDLILEHDTTPQTGTSLMESRCNTDTDAKRKLNFDGIIETPSSPDLKTGVIEDDKTDPTETIKSDQELEKKDKTVDSVCSSDATSKMKITSSGSSIQNILPKMDGLSSRETIPNPANLKMPSNSTANECRPLENVNSREENPNSEGKKFHQEKKDDEQFVEEDSGVDFSETIKTPSPRSNIPQKKIEKKNDHQLVEGDTADVFSQKNENNSPKTSLPPTTIGMDIASSSISKVVAENPKCKVGEEMWELALKSTFSETSDDLDNQTQDKGTALTKSYSKSSDLDVAVVKPSPRHKYGTAVSEASETFAKPDSNVNISPANPIPGNTRKESAGAAKIPVSQIKVINSLQYSKNPTNSSRYFPSPASGAVASTPHVPLQNGPKRPQEERLKFVDVASEEVLAAGLSKKLTENVQHEILPGNLQRAWGADLRHGAQGPHVRLLQTPAHFVHQDQYGHSFQTPNPEQQQQQEESHMTQPSFYNKVVVQHHNMNSDHPSTNSSVNVKVMPPLSNRIQTLPEQTVFMNNSPVVVNQQHAMMPKRDIRPGNDSFQGMLLDAQNNLRQSMPSLNDSIVAQGIDQVHAVRPLRYPTVTEESVYFHSPEHQHQQLPFQQQQIHFQQQQQQQQQLQQQQQQQLQQQQLHLHHHQQEMQQHIQYQTQQQRQQQQQQNLQQHQMQQRQQQQVNSQQRAIPDGATPIHQQQAVVTTQPPRHYPVLGESSQLKQWHDDFIKASINQDNLSHIPWGQHALDFGYPGDLRMSLPQYRQIPAPLPPNAPALFFNAQNSLSE